MVDFNDPIKTKKKPPGLLFTNFANISLKVKDAELQKLEFFVVGEMDWPTDHNYKEWTCVDICILRLFDSSFHHLKAKDKHRVIGPVLRRSTNALPETGKTYVIRDVFKAAFKTPTYHSATSKRATLRSTWCIPVWVTF